VVFVTWDKEAAAASSRRYYRRNKRKVKDADRRRRGRMRERVSLVKLKSGCVDCGYNKNSSALHFDHVMGEKVADVARLVNNGWGWKAIEAEIAKCEVRCANCHCERTWPDGRMWFS
jgi:hypothetical protein